ncbi:MAG: hypothetical protein L7F78_18625 [Syntrophales bacterium LBB04]|nr:hypothetical protein [Syntrophales bacterium LBB04]
MRYTIQLEPTHEPENPGWCEAHIPALDLTTHGIGPEGAMEAANEQATGWIAELRSRGEQVPMERPSFVGQIEIPDDAVHFS